MTASMSFINGIVSSFTLIGLAEMGDKSQLVCMSLALRYRAWPVFTGAIISFSLLNLMAIVLGVIVLKWMPHLWLEFIVGFLFLGFGLQSFWQKTEENAGQVVIEKSHRGIFLSTVLLIMLAEVGDKTQIAVAALATTMNGFSVWIGATAALILTSALGVWFGKKLLTKIPICTIHKLSGVLFSLMGISILMMAWRA